MFTKKMLAAALCMLSEILLFAAPPSKTVEAEGFGETIAVAIKNARENAVRKTFGEVVDSVAETKNEELIESTISASSGFVLSSKVIGAPQYDAANKFYVVKVSAVVATEKMKDHISRFKKSSTSVDLSDQLKASDNAEVQEKNAITLLKWAQIELLKAIVIKDIKLGFNEEREIILNFSADFDRKLTEKIQTKAKEILLRNGYKSIGRLAHRHWSSISENYNGSMIAFPVSNDYNDYPYGSEVKDFEFYNNPNALLFYGDKTHPQNWAQHKLKKIEAKIYWIVNGQKKLIALWDFSNDDVLKTVYFSSSRITAKTSMVNIIGFNTDVKASFKGNRPKFLGSRWIVEISDELLTEKNNEVSFEIDIEHADGKKESIIICKQTLNAQEVSDQKNSLINKDKAVTQLLVKAYRDSFKNIKIQANYSYDRFEDRGVIEYHMQMDRKGYFQQMRKLKSQLEELGYEHRKRTLNSGDEGLLVAARTKNSHGSIHETSDYFMYILLGGKIKEYLSNDIKKYQYFLVMKLKDKEQNVLKEIKSRVDNWREGAFVFYNPLTGLNLHLIFQVDSFRYIEQPGWKMKLDDFDVPEDAKNVKSVECYIEERIKQ